MSINIKTKNPNYTLDIHGDVNIDSGATLYIGNVNIKDFIKGTAPTVVVTHTHINNGEEFIWAQKEARCQFSKKEKKVGQRRRKLDGWKRKRA